MILFVEKYWKAAVGLFAIAVLALAASSWLREHDARILAEQTVKQSAARVEDLQKQAQADAAEGAAKVQALQKQAAAVRTMPQALVAIPTITDAPLNARAIPELPNAVAVDAVPLYEALNECKQTAVQLGTCSARAVIAEKVEAEQTIQIAALKQKRSFWKRFGTTAKDVGIGIAAGYVLSRARR